MEIAPFLPTAAGEFYLLYSPIGWMWVLGAFPNSFPMPFKKCPKAYQYSLGISPQLSFTLLAVQPARDNLAARPEMTALINSKVIILNINPIFIRLHMWDTGFCTWWLPHPSRGPLSAA
jgi:hypothetical protein